MEKKTISHIIHAQNSGMKLVEKYAWQYYLKVEPEKYAKRPGSKAETAGL